MTLKIIGFGILVALTSYLLSELGFRGKKIYSTLGLSLLVLYFVSAFGDFLSELLSIEISEVGLEAVNTALKIIGVSQAFSLAAEVASELSERGVSSALHLLGRLEILVISLPYLKKMISFVQDLVGSI